MNSRSNACATRTIEWLRCKLQTRPLVREGVPQKQDHTIQTATFRQEVTSGRKSHKGARYRDILTDWLTDWPNLSRKVASNLEATQYEYECSKDAATQKRYNGAQEQQREMQQQLDELKTT
jgi:hypothetical protein